MQNAGCGRRETDGTLCGNSWSLGRPFDDFLRADTGVFMGTLEGKTVEIRIQVSVRSTSAAGTMVISGVLSDESFENGGIRMKKIMAVYDEDPFYAERLSDYVNRKEKGIFKAQAFTSKERLEEFARVNDVDVLLTGETVDTEGISELKTVQKIYLTEDRGTETSGVREENSIYKYQSGDDIIRDVMAVYCELPGVKAVFPGLLSKEKRIVGVYSPVGRCGKTSLALAMGQVLAKEEKVLFISFDTYTGFSQMLDEQWKRDFSDLIYYYKQGRFHALRLNTIVYYLGDMAWIPPFRYPDDYSQVTAEEMADLMTQILNNSNYDTIVLDIGDYDRQVLPILDVCQVVYMPVKEDQISMAKMKEFEQYIEAFGNKTLKDKFHKIHVPLMTGTKRMEHFPQELLWGDMGDFVRGLLKGQRGLWES